MDQSLIQDYIILNRDAIEDKDSNEDNDPISLSKELQKLILKIKGNNLMNDCSVDYLNLLNSDLFKNDYIKLASRLKRICLDKLIEPKDEQLTHNYLTAFFINIYNALTIHSNAYLYETTDKSVREGVTMLTQLNGKFWSRMSYMIGTEGLVFSLDDIEHGILRANRPHPSQKIFFSDNDKRLKYSLKYLDPRIHFALNCGAKSCPPISFYTETNLDKSLEMATVNFITNETRISLDEKTVELSRLFLWYQQDFVQNYSDEFDKKKKLLKFIYEHLRDSDEKKEILNNLMKNNMNDIEIKYSNYNWELNTKS